MYVVYHIFIMINHKAKVALTNSKDWCDLFIFVFKIVTSIFIINYFYVLKKTSKVEMFTF